MLAVKKGHRLMVRKKLLRGKLTGSHWTTPSAKREMLVDFVVWVLLRRVPHAVLLTVTPEYGEGVTVNHL